MTFGHDDIRERLVEYLYGELDATARASFDAHVAGCASCRAETAAAGRARAVARTVVRAPLGQAVPLGLRARVLEAATAAVKERAAQVGAGGTVGAGSGTSTSTAAAPASSTSPATGTTAPPSRERETPPRRSWLDFLRGRWTFPTFATVAAMAAFLLVRGTIFREARQPLGDVPAERVGARAGAAAPPAPPAPEPSAELPAPTTPAGVDEPRARSKDAPAAPSGKSSGALAGKRHGGAATAAPEADGEVRKFVAAPVVSRRGAGRPPAAALDDVGLDERANAKANGQPSKRDQAPASPPPEKKRSREVQSDEGYGGGDLLEGALSSRAASRAAPSAASGAAASGATSGAARVRSAGGMGAGAPTAAPAPAQPRRSAPSGAPLDAKVGGGRAPSPKPTSVPTSGPTSSPTSVHGADAAQTGKGSARAPSAENDGARFAQPPPPRPAKVAASAASSPTESSARVPSSPAAAAKPSPARARAEAPAADRAHQEEARASDAPADAAKKSKSRPVESSEASDKTAKKQLEEREEEAQSASSPEPAPSRPPAVTVDPARTLWDRADKLLAARRFSEATAAYRDLLRRFPDHPSASLWRSRVIVAEKAAAAEAPARAAPSGR